MIEIGRKPCACNVGCWNGSEVIRGNPRSLRAVLIDSLDALGGQVTLRVCLFEALGFFANINLREQNSGQKSPNRFQWEDIPRTVYTCTSLKEEKKKNYLVDTQVNLGEGPDRQAGTLSPRSDRPCFGTSSRLYYMLFPVRPAH